MKVLMFVLIWSSMRPLMTSSTELLPDMAACNKASAQIQRAVNEAAVMGNNIIVTCTPLDEN